MKTLYKNIFLYLIMVLFAGCNSSCTTTKNKYENISTDSIKQNSNFNQEKYIWEDFLFPTNKSTIR